MVFFLPYCLWSTGLLLWGDAMGPRADADLLPRGQAEPEAPGAAGSTLWLPRRTKSGVWGPGSCTAGECECEAGRKEARIAASTEQVSGVC